MKTFLTILIPIAAIVGVIGLAFLARGTGATVDRTFSPYEEQTRRQTFEQSKAFRDGMIKDLQDLQVQYLNASDANKPAIATIIKNRASGIDNTTLPASLRSFIASL